MQLDEWGNELTYNGVIGVVQWTADLKHENNVAHIFAFLHILCCLLAIYKIGLLRRLQKSISC